MVNQGDTSLAWRERGWLRPDSALHCPSPNHDARPGGTAISLLVIHNISLPPLEFGGPYIKQLFTNTLDCSAHPWFENVRGLNVSAHFLIQRQGELTQFVSADDRAWHAGLSCWQGQPRCNDFSIGIELEGADTEPFTPAQYQRLAQLIPLLRAHYPLSAVQGHEHIAPGRKTDPGPFFDWRHPLLLRACTGLVLPDPIVSPPSPGQ